MNSAYESLPDEPTSPDLAPTGGHVEREPQQSSWVIRMVQSVLTTILSGIVVHGLMAPLGNAPTKHSLLSLTTAECDADASAAVTAAPASALASAARQFIPSSTTAASGHESLDSLHDIRGYLELARVKREARVYDLGRTSRHALEQLAITSESNR